MQYIVYAISNIKRYHKIWIIIFSRNSIKQNSPKNEQLYLTLTFSLKKRTYRMNCIIIFCNNIIVVNYNSYLCWDFCNYCEWLIQRFRDTIRRGFNHTKIITNDILNPLNKIVNVYLGTAAVLRKKLNKKAHTTIPACVMRAMFRGGCAPRPTVLLLLSLAVGQFSKR